MDPFLSLSATALAHGLRERRWSSRELVAAHIARIRKVNPFINALVHDRFDQALSEADAADAQLLSHEEETGLPPFLGVPCTIKENFALTGMPQTSGLVARKDFRATHDAPTVARIRAAGAIPMGVTNTPELCMWMETDNKVYGRTGNPYNPAHIAGGSSGGEGAIIGAGASPFGLGADVGGSIRMPAFFNGIFGHKPSPGIVPNTGQLPEPHGLVSSYCVTGPLTRRAEDLWPLMQILAGADGKDPACHGQLTGDPGDIRLSGLRVVSVPDNGRHAVHPELREKQTAVAHFLRESGCDVVKAPVKLLRQSFNIWSAMLNTAQDIPFRVELGQGQAVAAVPELMKLALRRSPHTFPALMLALVERVPLPRKYLQLGQQLRQQLDDLIGDGIMLYPSYSCPAPRHNVPLLKTFHWVYTAIINVMQLPATQVPLGLSTRGLPLGVQIIAAEGADARTIAVANALEKPFAGWVFPTMPGTR